MAITDDDIEKLKTIFATKAELTGSQDGLRGELKGDMDNLRSELKGDINNLRSELKGDMNNLKSELLASMENMKDQIIRAFGMTEENIRQDATHVDEHAALEKRVSRLEEHAGLTGG